MADIYDTINGWPAGKKISLLVLILVTVAGFVLLFSWVQRPDYHILYSNVSESDAGAIVQKLTEMRVPHEVRGSGIFVPSDRVYDVRLQLAAQGLPQGGVVGFELFDKTDFGTTDFVQKLNYRRAMQGELARTIMSLAEVERARVHLAIPEKSLFFQERARPSASVLVKLASGRVLSAGQVQGIVHLVSSSVEGLEPESVTVVDSRGQMLTRSQEAPLGLSAGQLEYQRNYEKEMEAKIIGLLEPVVGMGKVRAEVAADIDFTRSEHTEEKFDPLSQVARSEQRTMEKSVSGQGGGVPGVASNLPGREAAGAAPRGASSEKQNEVVNYEVSKVTRHVVSASGEVRRLSVAVLVDGTYAAAGGAGEAAQYTPRAEEDLRHYEELVKRAIGFSADRGDDVRVLNMPFETAAEVEVPEEATSYVPVALTGARYLAPVIAVILFFLMVLKPLMKTLSAPPRAVVREVAAEAPAAGGRLEAPRAERQIGGARGEILQWAEANPQKAADLIKEWLEERK
ncbi:MAG: flagellar basal-body MS-ring/collar protein FliF [Thermodesulfovibrionales bacterium]